MSAPAVPHAGASPAAGAGVRGAPGWLVAVVAVACLLPLTLTPVLPFIDFYAHVARYYVLAHIDGDPGLQAHYDAAWKLLPNLGLDVLGVGLMHLAPPLLVAKLVAALTMAAPFAGVLALARVLHGHVPPTTVFLAGILVFSHILVWGFANFLLGLGMMLGGLALWIGLADRPGRQLALSAAFGLALIFVHGLSFALWGLMLGTVELMHAHAAGELRGGPGLARRLGRVARRMARLAALAVLPALLFLQMETADAEGGVTRAFDNLAGAAAAGRLLPEIGDEILQRIDHTLRVADSGRPWIDRGLGLALWGGLAAALAGGALRLDRRLWLAAALAAALICALPPNLFGVGYLDDRMPLVLLALLAAGSRLPAGGGAGGRRVVAGLAGLLALRLALVSLGWAADGQVYRGYLAALRETDTGRMGAAALFDGTGDRDAPGTTCKPLSFLMLLENGTAVSTFANPTQQPLALDGPLLAARGAPDPVADAIRPGPRSPAEALADLRADGFDSVVACGTGAMPPPDGLVAVAAAPPWTLYRSRTDGRSRP